MSDDVNKFEIQWAVIAETAWTLPYLWHSFANLECATLEEARKQVSKFIRTLQHKHNTKFRIIQVIEMWTDGERLPDCEDE